MNRKDSKSGWALTALIVGSLVLAACQRGSDRPEPEPTAEEDGARSIFQPEFQVDANDPEPELAQLETRILFPEGTEITEEAAAELSTVLDSPQVNQNGAIVLRGHSDAGGSDDANLRISRERAEAVRDWLVENGIAEERITLIAFGEQNPIAPNALPDGSPNEEGRASNRRVDIEVRTPGATPTPTETPSLVETLASPDPSQGEESETE